MYVLDGPEYDRPTLFARRYWIIEGGMIYPDSMGTTGTRGPFLGCGLVMQPNEPSLWRTNVSSSADTKSTVLTMRYQLGNMCNFLFPDS